MPLIKKAIVLRCRPGSQFHFGKIAVDDETSLDETSDILHSDTLFSALVELSARAFPDFVDELIKCFDENLVRISSGFYLVELKKTGETIFFLPKPCTTEVGEKNKVQRKIRFISKGVWEAGIPSKKWTDKSECVILQNQFIVLRTEVEKFNLHQLENWQILNTHTLPKVAVHKESKEDSIYFQTNMTIPRQKDLMTHIYFLLEADDQFLGSELWNKLLNLIGLLGIEGIGGERSTGCGHIDEVTMEDFEISLSSPYFGLMSLFFPQDEEELEAVFAYKTFTRGGRRVPLQGSLKRVKMIAEGAVCGKPVIGKIIPILKGPDYDFRRSGKAFTIPVHQNFAPR